MDHSTADALLDVLEARRGIVALTGAGGKKSTLYRLLEAHRAVGTRRPAVTTTVQIAPPPRTPDLRMIVAEPACILSSVQAVGQDEGPVFVAAPSARPGRYAGLPQSAIPSLHTAGGFGVSLVKADGARMRIVKAPNDDEPVLPEATDTVLPILSAKAIGRSLSATVAHRPERIAAVIDAAIDTIITPIHVARLLSSDRGALRGVGAERVVPIINMVDTAEYHELAAEAAVAALAMTERYHRVVLASMINPEPVVDVIRRR